MAGDSGEFEIMAGKYPCPNNRNEAFFLGAV
jgi:hypothetical protein